MHSAAHSQAILDPLLPSHLLYIGMFLRARVRVRAKLTAKVRARISAETRGRVRRGLAFGYGCMRLGYTRCACGHSQGAGEGVLCLR